MTTEEQSIDWFRARVAELEAENALLKELVLTDPLTGAGNFRAFEDHLARESAVVRRNPNHPVGLLMIDLNDFHGFNKKRGHPIGDAALRLVAETAKTCVRGTDVVCRCGGDEFAVLLHSPACLADVLATANRIVAALAERQIETSKGPIGITISIGGAIAFGPGGLDSLVSRADEKLFEAKELKGDGNSHAAV